MTKKFFEKIFIFINIIFWAIFITIWIYISPTFGIFFEIMGYVFMILWLGWVILIIKQIIKNKQLKINKL